MAVVEPRAQTVLEPFDRLTQLDAQAIDEIYGLEPVFEPGSGAGELTRLVAVQCPYCGESIDTVMDLSAGSFRHVEDCQVCCQPIELAGEGFGSGPMGTVEVGV